MKPTTETSSAGDTDVGTALYLACSQMLTAFRFFRASLDTAEETLREIQSRLAGDVVRKSLEESDEDFD